MAGKVKPKTYLVHRINGNGEPDGSPPRLIKALTRASAAGFAAKGMFSVTIPSQDDLYQLARQSVEIESTAE